MRSCTHLRRPVLGCIDADDDLRRGTHCIDILLTLRSSHTGQSARQLLVYNEKNKDGTLTPVKPLAKLSFPLSLSAAGALNLQYEDHARWCGSGEYASLQRRAGLLLLIPNELLSSSDWICREVLTICTKSSRPVLSMTKDEFDAFSKLVPDIKKQMELSQQKLECSADVSQPSTNI